MRRRRRKLSIYYYSTTHYSHWQHFFFAFTSAEPPFIGEMSSSILPVFKFWTMRNRSIMGFVSNIVIWNNEKQDKMTLLGGSLKSSQKTLTMLVNTDIKTQTMTTRPR
jgi:hypothetical protein